MEKKIQETLLISASFRLYFAITQIRKFVEVLNSYVRPFIHFSFIEIKKKYRNHSNFFKSN